MPELPEVATVVTYLNKNIVNLEIEAIQVIRPKFLKNISAPVFVQQLVHEQILNIERYGKNIIFNFSHDKHFVSHLRMEGR